MQECTHYKYGSLCRYGYRYIHGSMGSLLNMGGLVVKAEVWMDVESTIDDMQLRMKVNAKFVFCTKKMLIRITLKVSKWQQEKWWIWSVDWGHKQVVYRCHNVGFFLQARNEFARLSSWGHQHKTLIQRERNGAFPSSSKGKMDVPDTILWLFEHPPRPPSLLESDGAPVAQLAFSAKCLSCLGP